jgi:hypothetical protein
MNPTPTNPKNPMNYEPLSHRTCDVCGTRIEWGPMHKDSSRHYVREGVCQCVGCEWYALRQAGEWTHHSYRDVKKTWPCRAPLGGGAP